MDGRYSCERVGTQGTGVGGGKVGFHVDNINTFVLKLHSIKTLTNKTVTRNKREHCHTAPVLQV